jgi:GNAT superfamily N-acetyltransferase
MKEIAQLHHELVQPPTICHVADIQVRTFCGPQDVPRWLELRHRAFARARLGVRQWTEADFHAEFLAKPWWRPEHLWLAEAGSELVGTVTLAMRGATSQARPVVHWLAVLPSWRRRGVGRMLMSVLEARAWELGYREVWLETHAAWTEAAALYRSLGYSETVH